MGTARLLPELNSIDSHGKKNSLTKIIVQALGLASKAQKEKGDTQELLDRIKDELKASIYDRLDEMALSDRNDLNKTIKELQTRLQECGEYSANQKWTIKQYQKREYEAQQKPLKKENWHDSQDAMVWAEKFVHMHHGKEIGSEQHQADEGLMVSWFANAMAASCRPFENSDHAFVARDKKVKEYQEEIELLNKQIASLNQWSEKRDHIPLASQFAGVQVDTEGNGRVMTPPRTADYGKPYMGGLNDPTSIEDPHTLNYDPVDEQIRNAEGTLVNIHKSGKRTYPIRDNPQA